MNQKKQRVRIMKKGDYHGRVAVVEGQDMSTHQLILKLRNKKILWPATESNMLQMV